MKEKLARGERIEDMVYSFGQVMAADQESREKMQHSLQYEIGTLKAQGDALFGQPSHLGRATAESQKRRTGVSVTNIKGI